MNNKTLVIAFGGVSPEHEVSVLSAIQAYSALEQTGFNLVPLYIGKTGKWLTGPQLFDLESYKDLKQLEQTAVPCAFVTDSAGRTLLKEQTGKGLFSKPKSLPVYAVLCAFHGGEGENGAFQGVCESFNIPYTGSGVGASAVGMDKVLAKQLCRVNGIPVADGIDFYESEWVKNQQLFIGDAEKIGYPLIVKPANLGSSIGVAKISSRDELIDAVESAFRYDAHLLIEEAVQPLMEINCSVLGTAEECEASVCEKPLGSSATLSYTDKYQSGSSGKGMASAGRIIPADISPELTDEIRTLAVQIFKVFGASGVARLDFLVHSETEKVYFNEINTIPGSFSFYLWEKSNLSFKSLLLRLIDIALQQHQQKNGRVRSYDTNLLSEKAAKGIKGLKGLKK